MEIRCATAADFDALVSCDSLAREHSDRRDFIARAIEDAEVYVACLGAAIVGYAVLEHTFFGNGFISLLYIAPKHRRQGYGSALMGHVESLCRTPKLFTSTNQSNTIMQSLLEKLGFAESGWIDNLDEGDPELVYFKRVAMDQSWDVVEG